MMIHEPINFELQRHQQAGLQGWHYAKHFELFHRFCCIVNERFFRDQPLPLPAISVERVQRRVELGHYLLGRDGIGLCHRINISAHAVAERSRLEQLSILGHELVHLWQYTYARPAKTAWYHNRVFCDKAASLGIIAALGRGHTLNLQEPFISLCRELGVDDTVPAPKPPALPERPNPLAKWTCQCCPPVNLRVGRRVIRVRCEDCGARFVRREGVLMFKSKPQAKSQLDGTCLGADLNRIAT